VEKVDEFGDGRFRGRADPSEGERGFRSDKRITMPQMGNQRRQGGQPNLAQCFGR
jgi:hypothetical protein